MSERPPLDEHALRKPDFAGGVGVILDDGQEWFFPKPILVSARQTVVVDGGKVGIETHRTLAFHDEFDAVFMALTEELSAADDPDAQRIALAKVAVNLLNRNYAIDGRDFARLLSFDPASDAPFGNVYWLAIVQTAMGIGPKTSPVGSNPASGPTG